MALDIKVYARKGWATCARTKEFLSKNGFEYIERDIQNDSGALQELRKVFLSMEEDQVLRDTEITMIGLDSGNYPPRSDLTGRSYNSFNDIADYGKGVLEAFKSKVSELDLDKLAQIGPRGEDDRSVSERLDLVAGHTVQHLRQLYFVL